MTEAPYTPPGFDYDAWSTQSFTTERERKLAKLLEEATRKSKMRVRSSYYRCAGCSAIEGSTRKDPHNTDCWVEKAKKTLRDLGIK